MRSRKHSIKTNRFPSEKEISKLRLTLSTGIASRPLPEGASQVERMKHELCEQFVVFANKERLTNRALAKKLGINESLTSKILHYHYEEFTVDRLATFLEKLYKHITLTINVG